MNATKKKENLGFIHNTQLIHTLLSLPNKILQYHETDGLVQMVLHELAHEQHLGLKRATYLVDSPDFDCLKGVAGFCRNECNLHKKDLWQDPHAFSADMRGAAFHNNTLKMLRSSLHKKNIQQQDLKDIASFGKDLGIDNPEVYVWDLKHGNHGILIYEKLDTISANDTHDVLDNISALLGLCYA